MIYDRYSCCEGLDLVDFSKIDMDGVFDYVYWDEPSFWSAAFSIVITPIYWIVVSQIELRTHVLRRLFCSRHVAVSVFAVTVILMSLSRDWRFLLALRAQPKWLLLQENVILWLGHILNIFGFILVLRSLLGLGFIATFMGDYFGLFLPRRVTSFPYSWMTHPMYTGSFMMFLGMAIVQASQAGIVLAAIAGVMYTIVSVWEEPYTDHFYITYPKGTRTVGVQVSCCTSIIEIKARTVSTQTNGKSEEVTIIDDEEENGADVDIVESPSPETMEEESKVEDLCSN